jgi:quinone-modifying oxidoreductase subunit QmoA
MDKTKAIFLPFAMAYPMRYVIDDTACKKEDCAKCVDACRYNAIDLNDRPKTYEAKVGSIVIATGWDPYDAGKLDNLGYDRYANVITNMEFERLAAPNGPTRGEMVRISDGKPIQRIAFIQCAGSRDENHLAFCSTICCLGTLKQSTYLREKVPEGKSFMFYIDVRTPGKFEPFCNKVGSGEGVTLVKGKVAKITEDPNTKDLTVEAEQMLSGEKIRVGVDLVVLATGMNPSAAASRLPVPVPYDEFNFAVETENDTGIHVAGCAKRPVDVASAIQDATGTALKAIQSIVRSKN